MPYRTAVGEPRSVSVKFPAVADGTVTATITSARSTSPITPITATSGGGGTYSITIPPAQVAAVDELTISFAGSFTSVPRSLRESVEVAGEHYFTIADARSIGRLDSTFTDSMIERIRKDVEDQIEANLDTSMVARYVVERVNGPREAFIRLTEPYVLNLVKVLEDGVDVTADCSLDGRYVWHTGRGAWSFGHRNIEVHYEKGYDTVPPGDLARKAIEATRHQLMRETGHGTPAQAANWVTPEGAMRLYTASLKAPFGLPEVDAVVAKYAAAVGTDL